MGLLRVAVCSRNGCQAYLSGPKPFACIRRVSRLGRYRDCSLTFTSCRGEFVYDELLDLIEQGTLSLTQAPQVIRDPLAKVDASLVWTRWTLRLPAMNAREILEECLKLAAEQFGATAETDLPRAIEEEIARDLSRLQNQPVIMDNYRRFAVIKTQHDKQFSRDSMRGVRRHSLVRVGRVC